MCWLVLRNICASSSCVAQLSGDNYVKTMNHVKTMKSFAASEFIKLVRIHKTAVTYTEGSYSDHVVTGIKNLNPAMLSAHHLIFTLAMLCALLDWWLLLLSFIENALRAAGLVELLLLSFGVAQRWRLV